MKGTEVIIERVRGSPLAMANLARTPLALRDEATVGARFEVNASHDRGHLHIWRGDR